MLTTIDYRQQLLKEIDALPPRALEKIYQMVIFLKEEFIEPDEARYYTPAWMQAEQAATEAYAQGGLPRFHSVRELAEYIEFGETTFEDHIYLRNVGGHEILP